MILGFTETKSESHPSVVRVLQDLQARGFRASTSLLVMLDGAKGLRKGVKEVFGDQALIQRCQWHKRENVASKIPHADVAEQVRNEMEAAYAAPTYADAKKKRTALMKRLDARSPAAAASVREGLEETLTLHKLGIPKPLRDQLRTTNIMESVNSRLAHTTRRISRWQNSDQRQRWVATACLDIEKRSLNPIKSDWQLEMLIRALRRHEKTIHQSTCRTQKFAPNPH